MTLIVEDGTRPAGANTYVSAADFISYSAARGYTIDPTQAEMWLIMAMDYLETLEFIGYKSTQIQTLQWPRFNIVIDTWWVPSPQIPVQLPKAQSEIALQISLGNDPLQNRSRRVKAEQVGSIKREFEAGNSALKSMPVKIISLLSKLVVDGASSFSVSRA